MTVLSKAQSFQDIPLKDCRFIVFDIETTGGNPENNGLTEIFALRYVGGVVEETFYTMVNPKRSIPPIVRKITGITNQMVRQAPAASEVVPEFLKFIGSDVLVSHNTIGDLKFIRYFAQKYCGVEVENLFLCTHLLSEKLLPEAGDKSLTGLGKFLKLKTDGNAHRADSDGYLTLELFLHLWGLLDKAKVNTLHEAIRLQGDMFSGLKVGWAISPKELQKVAAKPGVIRFQDRQGKDVFVTACVDMNKSLRKLMHFEKLPKRLTKILLASYSIKSEVCDYFIQAALKESEYFARGNFSFDPTLWHNRQIQGYYIQALPQGQFALNIGKLPAQGLDFFGPVHDCKDGLTLVDEIGKAFDLKTSKSKGLVFPSHYREVIVAFLGGYLSEFKEKVTKDLESLRSLFSPARKRNCQKILEKITCLEQLGRAQVRDLLGFQGVFVVKTSENALIVYPIHSSQMADPLFIDKPLVEWLKTSNFLSTYFNTFKIPQKGLKEAKDLKKICNVNAALWFIFLASKRDQSGFGQFFSLNELHSIVRSGVKYER